MILMVSEFVWYQLPESIVAMPTNCDTVSRSSLEKSSGYLE